MTQAKGENMQSSGGRKWIAHHDHEGTDHEWSLQDDTRAFLLFNFHPDVPAAEARKITNLIAAAPAMVEALEWIMEIADKNYEQDEKLRSPSARTLIRISDRARAALSQATGQST